MAEHHYHETRETKSGGGTLAFIVGGLVVAVGLILFWVFGDLDMGTGAGTAGDTNVEINATSDSAAGAASDDGADAGAAVSSSDADAGAATTADSN